MSKAQPAHGGLRPVGKNRLQTAPASGFGFRPTSAGQGGQSCPASGGNLPFALRGGRGVGFLDNCPAGALRGADSGNPRGAYLFPLPLGGGNLGRCSKQLAEFLLKSINSLFDVGCPT